MQNIIALLIILLSLTFCFAQQKPLLEANWRSYNNPKEDFSVEIPWRFTLWASPLKDSVGKEIASNTRYSLIFNNQYFYVFSEGVSQKNTFNSYLSEQLKALIKDNNAQPENINISGNQGLKYSFVDDEKFLHKIVFINTAQHNYIFHAFAVTPDNDYPVERFIDSIKLGDHSASDLSMSQNQTISKTDDLQKSNLIDNTTKGAENKNLTEQSVTTPIKLLERPRAQYTDLAKFYAIGGTIILQVAFLADGTTEPTVVSRLPLGLTNSAIEAARKITFEPAKKDGVPVTTTKTVQYNLSLF